MSKLEKELYWKKSVKKCLDNHMNGNWSKGVYK